MERIMIEPTYDKDGYPTEATLKTIEKWGPTFTKETGRNLLDFCFEAWSSYGWSEQFGDEWSFATGGWSGNEEIIGAMMENRVFWSLCWELSMRGGQYKFSLKGLPE